MRLGIASVVIVEDGGERVKIKEGDREEEEEEEEDEKKYR